MLPYYPPQRTGLAAPELHWYSALPWLAYQAGRPAGSASAGRDTGWGTTLVLAGVVGVGVVGYLLYRNFVVSEAAVRGAFGEEEV